MDFPLDPAAAKDKLPHPINPAGGLPAQQQEIELAPLHPLQRLDLMFSEMERLSTDEGRFDESLDHATEVLKALARDLEKCVSGPGRIGVRSEFNYYTASDGTDYITWSNYSCSLKAPRFHGEVGSDGSAIIANLADLEVRLSHRDIIVSDYEYVPSGSARLVLVRPAGNDNWLAQIQCTNAGLVDLVEQLEANQDRVDANPSVLADLVTAELYNQLRARCEQDDAPDIFSILQGEDAITVQRIACRRLADSNYLEVSYSTPADIRDIRGGTQLEVVMLKLSIEPTLSLLSITPDGPVEVLPPSEDLPQGDDLL